MAEEPLTEEEQEIVLKYAKEYDEAFGGFNGTSIYKTIIFLLDTGIHPKSARPGNVILRRTRDGNYLKWNRTKKKGLQAPTMIPLPITLEEWIDEYLENGLLLKRQYYWDACKSLRDFINTKLKGDMPEYIKQLCPRQLRHTFGVNRVCGIRGETCDPHEVKDWMNCSWKTLEFYLRRKRAMKRKW